MQRIDIQFKFCNIESGCVVAYALVSGCCMPRVRGVKGQGAPTFRGGFAERHLAFSDHCLLMSVDVGP